MPIPITCTGCKSAFDVPAHLAGKAIRCTSCKAQMSVPAPDAVEAGDGAATAVTKKPFGSSSSEAKPALPPKPAPVAKSAPAKPAAKPAVIVADEDDEDEKPRAKPGASASDPKKSTIKGAPRKRRDDDDDDDDRPRKKKKKQDSSGTMVVIIAGAALGLVLIVGGAIYLLSSGSDDKKNETAASTPSTAGTPSAPPAGLPGAPSGPSGPGGPGSPGRQGGPGTSAQTSGSSAALPGGALAPLPGAGGPAPGGPGGGDSFGAFGKIDQIGVPGPKALFTGDGFTAEFPGTPGTKTENVMGMSVKITGIASKNNEPSVLATIIDFPSAVLQAAGNNPQVVLANFVGGIMNNSAFQGKPVTDGTLDGNAAKEINLSRSGAIDGKVKITAVKNRVYMFIAGGPYKDGKPTMSHTEIDQFFNSIKITYTGNLVAGGPPGAGGPMPGGPPMAPGTGQLPGGPPMPGAPGIGGPAANPGDGNLKVKIENFYTAAFDTEKKEMYTVDERIVDARTKRGWLRRYAYPDFKRVIGRYHLPHLASRAVIDSKAGLLYLATVTNPATARINWIDNASAHGDIAIYDLKPIQEGKTADGKELKDGAELRPVATVSIKHTIHAIELSDDGKSLYVLTTSATPKKSSLVVIDTETRKDTKEPLTILAKDMAKASDGKSLLIISDYSIKTKSASVATFDTTSKLLTNSISFPGAVLDVAPLKSGGAMVTVAPAVQPATSAFGGQPGGPGALPGGPGALPGGPGALPGGPGALPGGPGRLGGPGGEAPGGAGAPQAHKVHFQLYLLDSKGSTEMDLGAAPRYSNAGYAKYDADNKKLYVSSYQSTGFDAFEVTDAGAANGLKLQSSIRTARREQLGGHFLITPDEKALVFHNGVVIDPSNIGGTPPNAPPAGGPAPGLPGGGAPGFPGGAPMPPGGMPAPGTLLPGGPVPPGGMGSPPGGMGSPPGGMGSPPGGMGSPPGQSAPLTPAPAGGLPTPAAPGGKPPSGSVPPAPVTPDK